MAINLGNNSITNAKLGNVQLTKIMLGTVQIFPAVGSTTTTTTASPTTTTTTTLLTLHPTTVGYNVNDYQLACGAATATYYIDNSSFTLAGYIYADFTGETFAADGYYSNGTIYRQSINGILHAPEACA